MSHSIRDDSIKSRTGVPSAEAFQYINLRIIRLRALVGNSHTTSALDLSFYSPSSFTLTSVEDSTVELEFSL